MSTEAAEYCFAAKLSRLSIITICKDWLQSLCTSILRHHEFTSISSKEDIVLLHEFTFHMIGSFANSSKSLRLTKKSFISDFINPVISIPLEQPDLNPSTPWNIFLFISAELLYSNIYGYDFSLHVFPPLSFKQLSLLLLPLSHPQPNHKIYQF